jgi:hypothetical protein
VVAVLLLGAQLDASAGWQTNHTKRPQHCGLQPISLMLAALRPSGIDPLTAPCSCCLSQAMDTKLQDEVFTPIERWHKQYQHMKVRDAPFLRPASCLHRVAELATLPLLAPRAELIGSPTRLRC